MMRSKPNHPLFSADPTAKSETKTENQIASIPPSSRIIKNPKLMKIDALGKFQNASFPIYPRENREYAYRSIWTKRIFRTIDLIGSKIFQQERERPQNVSRVLVMRPDHLGDVLFSFPTLEFLQDALPNCQIDLLLSPGSRHLLPAKWDEVDRIGILEFSAPWLIRPKKNRWGFRGMAELIRLLRVRQREIGGCYDVVIDLRGDFQLILAARMAGARFLVGRGHTGFGFALDKELIEVEGRHQVENNFALLELAGFGPQKTYNPFLVLSDSDIEQARALLRPHGINRSKVLVGIHPGAGLATKRWGANKFADLIRRMISDLPVRIVLLGGIDDRSVADDILANLKGVRLDGRFVDFCGRLPDLRSFMAVSQHCSLFIGNDSGPSHIAAALDVPLICLFSGTNDPGEWGPRGSSVVIIRHRIECEKCALSICEHHSCMQEIDVERVFQAVRRCV